MKALARPSLPVLVCLLAAGFLAACTDSPVAPAEEEAALEWSEASPIETVAAPADFNDLRDVVVDKDGLLHVLYVDIDRLADRISTHRLLYVRQTEEGSWTAPKELAFIDDVWYASLTLDESGDAHAVWWQDRTLGDNILKPTVLSTMRMTDGQPTEIVDVTGSDKEGRGVDLALGSDGRLHVLTQLSGFFFHYVSDRGENWELVDQLSDGGSTPNLAVSPSGRLELGYIDADAQPGQGVSRSNVYFGIMDNEGGLARRVLVHEDNNTYSYDPQLAIAPEGRRHLVWEEGAVGSRVIMHAHGSNGLYWSIPKVITPSPFEMVGQVSSATDGAGRLHVMFGSRPDSRVHYLMRDVDGSWSRMRVLFNQFGETQWSPTLVYDEERRVMHLLFGSLDGRIYHSTMDQL